MRFSLLGAILAALVLFSCAPEKDPALEAIEAKEVALEQEPSQEGMKELVEAYQQYVTDHPDQTELNAELLHKAAFVLGRMNRYAAAQELLKQAIKDFYPAEKTPANVLFMGSIFQNRLRKTVVADATYQAFLKAFPDNEKVSMVKDSLLSSSTGLETIVNDLRSNIYNDSTNRIDFNVANDFIEVATIHGMVLPQAEATPELLHEAAKTAGYIRAFPKALDLYQWVYDRYPEHSKAGQSLFMMAFTYENEMKDAEKAKSLYEQFLAEYPGNDFADDAKFLLENLGKSDEEIIKSFGGN